eukprot:scaffold219075_cov20-Tisochrysis_lutea.AAC.1
MRLYAPYDVLCSAAVLMMGALECYSHGFYINHGNGAQSKLSAGTHIQTGDESSALPSLPNKLVGVSELLQNCCGQKLRCSYERTGLLFTTSSLWKVEPLLSLQAFIHKQPRQHEAKPLTGVLSLDGTYGTSASSVGHNRTRSELDADACIFVVVCLHPSSEAS